MFLSWPSRLSAFMFLSWPSRPSAFMPLVLPSLVVPLGSFSVLWLLDFMPGSSARWPLDSPGDFCISDWPDFMPDEGSFCVVAPPVLLPPVLLPPDGVLCCVAAPPPSRFMPPCAFAPPAPAISAMAATETRKRLVIPLSSHVCLPRANNEMTCDMFLGARVVPRCLFLPASGTKARKRKGRLCEPAKY